MFVGVLEIDLLIRGNSSLKGKRKVLNSIKDRTRRKFNVSIAEVDYNDLLQRARLGICCVTNDKVHAGRVLGEAVKFIGANFEAELLDYSIEIL